MQWHNESFGVYNAYLQLYMGMKSASQLSAVFTLNVLHLRGFITIVSIRLKFVFKHKCCKTPFSISNLPISIRWVLLASEFFYADQSGCVCVCVGGGGGGGGPLFTGGFFHKGPVKHNFDGSFDISLNWLLKNSRFADVVNVISFMWRHCQEEVLFHMRLTAIVSYIKGFGAHNMCIYSSPWIWNRLQVKLRY